MTKRLEIPPIVTAFIGLLKSDPSPKDLDIAVLDVDYMLARSDPFVKVDQHVGIDASNLPTLVRQFCSHHKNLRKNRLAINTTDTYQWNHALMDATSCLLCLCPDNSTAWGDRSRCILFYLDTFDNKPAADQCRMDTVSKMDSISLLQEELIFLNFLFTRHSNKYVHVHMLLVTFPFPSLLCIICTESSLELY